MQPAQPAATRPRYKRGDRVGTPAHGVCEIESVATRRARGKPTSEHAYNMRAPGLTYMVWYYESDLKPA